MDKAAPVTPQDPTKSQTTATQNGEQVESINGAVDQLSASTNNSYVTMPRSPSTKPSKSSLILALFALMISLAIAGALYELTMLAKQHVLQTAQKLDQMQTYNQQQAVVLQQFTQQMVQTQNQVLQLQNNLTAAQASLQKVLQDQPGYDRAWTLAEVDYLVRSANIQLQFNNSATNAIALLQIANDRLTHLSDPTLVNLSQALGTDTAELQALPVVNVADILTRLSTLNGQIAELPQVAPSNLVSESNIDENNPENANKPWWKKLFFKIKHDVMQLVVINYHNKPLPQLLPPQQQLFLQQNLQLLLVQAQWAALQNNQAVYTNSLQQANHWIRQYYVQDAPNTIALLQALDKLQQIKLRPTYPDLTTTLNLLHTAAANPPQNTHLH